VVVVPEGGDAVVRALFRGRRPSVWTALVPVVALAAGLLFATSGRTALGTDLRAGEVADLAQLIEQRDRALSLQVDELADLEAQVQRLAAQAGRRDGDFAAAQAEGQQGELSAALVALRGPGLVITLDDAPSRPDGSLPTDARPDDLVIHQSDVQAVVNALWAAAADGVAIMDQRLIATIVDADAARAQLAVSPQVAVFEQAVEAFGLTFEVIEQNDLTLPAYHGPLDMEYAERLE
jgi:uncharacterized protein YlxW (UPF0749 family)